MKNLVHSKSKTQHGRINLLSLVALLLSRAVAVVVVLKRSLLRRSRRGQLFNERKSIKENIFFFFSSFLPLPQLIRQTQEQRSSPDAPWLLEEPETPLRWQQ